MTETILSFGDCELDSERRQLRRNGTLIAVEPRVFDLLLEVIDKRERVVAHRELVETVWKGQAVSRSAVNAGMSRVRSAVGDHDGRLIKSFRRYGYRFIGEVQPRLRAAPTTALIGRGRELELLESLASHARNGHGRIVYVHGDAGIGKTRLIETLASRANEAGVPVFHGLCDESENPPLLWPWVQILGACIAAPGGDLRRTQLAAYGGELARVLPAFRGSSAPPSLAADDAAQARVRLLQAMTDAIARLAVETPMLMILDDAQWADADSIRVLRQLTRTIRQTRLLLLVADRTPPAGRRFTAAENDSTVCLPLDPLDRSAIAELAAALSEEVLSERRLAALHDLSGGNPLFLRELVRHADFGDDDEPHGVPETLHELLEKDLVDLPAEARRMLQYAAASRSQTFSPGTLQRAAGMNDAELVAAIDRAVRARAILPLRDQSDTYRFRLPLQRLHLRSTLTRPQRVKMREALQRAESRASRSR
ncbi:MAG TPA: AAA family ATPase [Terriglobales bacterium]|nr:AAA family ATPase [Terriglobales bacterium]